MIISSRGRNVEVRSTIAEDALIPRLSDAFGTYTSIVRPATAMALPAVSQAVRMIAEDVGKLPLQVFDDAGGDRTLARGTWQWRLLHDFPRVGAGPAQFYGDVATSLLLWGNAYIEKVKRGGRVEELYVLDPAMVAVRRERGQTIYRYGDQDGLTTDRVIHVRGFSYGAPGAIVAPSPIDVHRSTLGSYLALLEYVARFYANDASPGGVISFPFELKIDKAREFLDLWNSEHRGAGNAHKTSALGGGASYVPISVNPREAQLVETYKSKVQDVGRVFNMPASKLSASDFVETPADEQHYLEHALSPVFSYIEDAFRSDPDLFGPGSSLHPKFLVDAILRADPSARAQIVVQYRQTGVMTPNEGRELLNLPRSDQPGADSLQVVPTGSTDRLPQGTKQDDETPSST